MVLLKSKRFVECEGGESSSMRLDPAGELLALTTHGHVKNLIVGGLELSGALDMTALREAVALVAMTNPQLTKPLVEKRFNGRYFLQWDQYAEKDIPFIEKIVHVNRYNGSHFDLMMEELEPHLSRERNLFREPACEVHLLKLDETLHILAVVMCHIAADGVSLLEIVEELLANYHFVTKRTALERSQEELPSSTAGKRYLRTRKTTFRDYMDTLRHASIPYLRCAIPLGSGEDGDFHEHHVKRLMSPLESRQIIEQSMALRVSVVDYILACTIVAVDEWNRRCDTEVSFITAALTVNMNGRFGQSRCTNNDSILYFRSDPQHWGGVGALGRWLYSTRMKQFRKHIDVKYAKGMRKLNNWLRFIPYSFRRKIYMGILGRHQTSFALGFLGVLWPETSGRALTGNSWLTSSGGLKIVEVHGMAYRIFSRTPLYLCAYFYGKQLNLILSAASSLFTREEADDFLGLITTMLLNHSQDSPS